MNELVNRFLSSGDWSMPEMHFKQPGFTYSDCEPFTKNKERIQKLKKKTKTGDAKYICRTKLDKACVQHDVAYRNFKDLVRRAASDKGLRDKAFNIAKNPKYDGCQRDLASVVYKCFDQKTPGGATKSMPNQQLPNELMNRLFKFKKKKKVYSSYKDNIWGAYLADMQLISKSNKGIRF